MGYNYQFPPFYKPGKPLQQMAKVMEEVAEMAAEVYQANPGGVTENWRVRACMECFDIIHACETFLQSMPGAVVELAYSNVIEKNERRGYYLTGDNCTGCPWMNTETNECDRRAADA